MTKKLCLLILIISAPALPAGQSLSNVKICRTTGRAFDLPAYRISISSDTLMNEATLLREAFHELGIREDESGVPVHLNLTDIDIPVVLSKYRDEIYGQGYHLQISPDEIVIESPGAAGICYGIQTLSSLCTSYSLPEADIRDWPDFPIRMIMVDPARQLENKAFYRKLIKFCARYKINRIQIHLTDHETSALYHEDYPELMHQYAWKEDEIQDLLRLASRFHIKLIPEIESFGHSRMFIRMKDAVDYLHQTEMMSPDAWWVQIDIPGYTNMLCPASKKAHTYLDKMYQRATLFESDHIHIGFDEVHLSNCKRCEDKFGNISGPALFRKHLNHCVEIATPLYNRIGVWGDMILKHPEILNCIPRNKVIIYDWHYFPDVSAESVDLFQEHGFEVIACPALMCWPHIMTPDHNNYTNISRFIRIAREKELPGVSTTIWVPTRYMSDILWTGIAWAAVQSWGGSHFDEAGFYNDFMQRFFGSSKGDAFMKIWKDLSDISIHLDRFHTASWIDEQGLEKAIVLAAEQSQGIKNDINRLNELEEELSRIRSSVTKHPIEWKVIERTTAMRGYVLRHLLAAPAMKNARGWNLTLLKKLDEECDQIIKWIEADWDRNRYADDANKNGIYSSGQHILHRFKQMHRFHQRILGNDMD
ncbi:MAG: family 20 glycosylhydrolase [candidate division KSB1 bacterium]|jgi:hypothetical protein|nr:family 20 glycosylhydrolase [candidate division KSB1 bacterium]